MSSTQQALTLDQFLQLPETEPASEYVDGQVVQKVSPKARHSRLQVALIRRIEDLAEKDQRGMALTELRCTFAGRSLVFDIAYLQWDRIHFDETGAPEDDVFDPPDWAIEIISPGQTVGQLTDRLSWCVDNGVRIGWLVDHQREQLWTFRPGREPQCLQGAEIAQADGVLPGCSFRVEEIFGWLRPAAKTGTS